MTVTVPLDRQWRFIVTGLRGVTVTFLDRLATNREVAYLLNAPSQASGDLPSDNPEVNILRGDGDPFVSCNNRLLYGFRREERASSSAVPWVCRFAGIMAILEDEAQSDQPMTHYTAIDPWGWLNSVPVVTSALTGASTTAAGNLLGPQGLKYTGVRGNAIALDLLSNALTVLVAMNPSQPLFIDQASGHFDSTDVIPEITFQQGCSVGEAWTQLTDTGSMDIVLTPLYDPVVRPGKLSILNIYSLAGSAKPSAVFAWDKAGHSLVGVSRLHDGTQMGNHVQFYSQGGPATAAEDAASIAEYGEYWLQRSYPGQPQSAAVALLAEAALVLRKKGKTTVTIDPAPERAPDPFTEYLVGDSVPIWAGRPTIGGGVSFRELLSPGSVSGGEWTNAWRIYGLPISISDNEMETVEQLLLTDPNA